MKESIVLDIHINELIDDAFDAKNRTCTILIIAPRPLLNHLLFWPPILCTWGHILYSLIGLDLMENCTSDAELVKNMTPKLMVKRGGDSVMV